MRLSLGIYDRPGGTLLLDASYRARNAEFSKDRHGCKAFRFDLPLPFYEALRLYEQVKTPHVLLSHGLTPIWSGRLEDPELSLSEGESGLSVQALGYWRAWSDIPATALYSTTKLDEWDVLDETQIADATPKRFECDSNNRLYIAAKKNEVMGANRIGYIGFKIPSLSSRQIVALSFDYAWSNAAGWQWGVQARSSTWGFTSNIDTVAGGTSASGTKTLTFTGTDAIVIFFRFNGVDTPYGGETGNDYLRITNIRIKTTTASSVTASLIASDLLSAVRAVNSAQLDSSTQLLQNPGVDLRDEVYLDANMGQILDRLAVLGDTQTRTWEVGIDLFQRLYLRPRGSAGRAWYSDVTDLRVVRTLDALYNSAYAVYQDASNTTVRSATSTDSASVNRWGLTRRAAVETRTTSSGQAATHRDTFLDDRSDPTPQAALPIDEVYDARGTRWPLWMVEPGASITARNLARTLGTTIDRIRTFLVDEVTYNLDEDTLQVVPESPRPSLDTVFLRRDAGIV